MMKEFGKGLAAAVLPATLLVGSCAAPQGQEPTTSAPTPASTPAQPSAPTASASGGVRTASSGIYTTAQADRGAAVYRASCLTCHNAQEFTGTAFNVSWGSRPLADFHQFISEMMPMDAPGSLTAQQYTDIVAYIVRQNGYPAGATELPNSREALRQFRFRAQ